MEEADIQEDEPASESVTDVNASTSSQATQTNVTGKDVEALERTTQHLTTVKNDLQDRVTDSELTEDSFRNDQEKVKTFTGLQHFLQIQFILDLIRPHLKEKNASLTPFQQLLLVLMRMRLNATVKYLSYVFKVHHSTVVRYFLEVIHVLNEKFVPLTVIWPDRSEIRKTLPYIFSVTYPKCVSIIDCFEIFIERASNLESRANTYSNYKSHNTVKYLISMAPQGSVNFISKGWGGRTSDKTLTENCGYLENLVTGDVVLADRGFTVKESIALHGAALHIPAFTKGKSQLPANEINQTRHLASVRIHIERVIGNIRKKYSILDSTIPITLLHADDTGFTTLDKIVRVACGLTNICDSIVPSD